ncbi:MAG: hypothetical protein QOI10_792 [Solirubrobacterales bacterium]|jgi:hypothetical protein|nr:hypothetical protein [Solirubrobacterales bacterium]
MREVLETEAIEMPVLDDEDGEYAEPTARPLPATIERQAELSAWKGEARTAAIAAAGGLVVGAATVALARATRGGSSKRPAKRSKSKARPVKVVASRSFLVDVHLIDR